MRKLMLILSLWCCASLMHAKVTYLSTDTVFLVPEGKLTAIEVRAAHHAATVGASNVTKWGIKWDNVEIEAIFNSRNFVEGIDQPYITIKCGGNTGKLNKGINCSGGFNTMAIEWDENGKASILFGERRLSQVLAIDSLPTPIDSFSIMPQNGNLEIAEVMVETNENALERLRTNYTADELAAAPRWQYLDRENDPKIALLGGRYELAQIGNDLIYLSGAKTNATHWHQGMLKGRLKPTGYVGYYHLEWFDATGRSIADDCYAQFDETSKTMTVNFPGLNASLRFAFRE